MNDDLDGHRARHAAARRAVAARLHPDRGGDHDAFVAALRAVDEAYAVPPSALQDLRPAGVVRRTVSRTARRARRAGRRARAAVPRSWPGSRRYGRL